MVGTDIKPAPKIGLNATLSYTKGMGSIKDFFFASMYPTGDVKLDYNVSSLNPNMPYLYDVAYINGIQNYSNLDFSEFDFTFGATYRLTNTIGLGLHYFYDKFTDKEPYVYGDQGTEVQSVLGVLTYRF
ncbi:MAG: hypothetical protein ACP5J5_00875 [Dissulfurimicrobium sp.]